jgi:hypothetical protein
MNMKVIVRYSELQGPLYGIGCHNPSGLPITFYHLKASIKHIYLFNAMAILL